MLYWQQIQDLLNTCVIYRMHGPSNERKRSECLALLCRVFEINHERRVTVLINVGISNSVSYSLVWLLQKGKKLLVKISLYHKKVREHPTGNVCGECQITKIYSHQILVAEQQGAIGGLVEACHHLESAWDRPLSPWRGQGRLKSPVTNFVRKFTLTKKGKLLGGLKYMLSPKLLGSLKYMLSSANRMAGHLDSLTISV